MKKAYCVFSDFNSEAAEIIKRAGIDLTINNSENRPKGDELASILKEYDIIIIGGTLKITSDMLESIKTPKIIATLSVGLDHIDKSFFESPLVTIVNIKTANAISVAEHIFSLILTLNKRIYESNQLVLEGRGHKANLHEVPVDISGKTLGLIGCGNINKEVIRIANAFNMKIMCYTKNPNNHTDVLDKGIEFVPLDFLLKESDIINICVPLNDETKNLISKDKIKLMKQNATFINASRVGVVDTKSLIEYAELYDTFYVGLDIDTNEFKDLFMKYRNNVIVTPHIAGISKEARYRMDIELATRVLSILDIK